MYAFHRRRRPTFWQTRLRVALLINLVLIVSLQEIPFPVDHVGIHKPSYACGWTTCVWRGLPQNSRFTLISHIRSHTGEKESDFTTNFGFVPVSKKERGSPMIIDRSPTSQNPTVLLPLSPTTRGQVHPYVLSFDNFSWDSYISAIIGMATGTEGSASGGDVNMEGAAGEPADIDPDGF